MRSASPDIGYDWDSFCVEVEAELVRLGMKTGYQIEWKDFNCLDDPWIIMSYRVNGLTNPIYGDDGFPDPVATARYLWSMVI